MDREELILSCQECVDRLVRKYNDFKSDDDLQQTGMVAVIECVDRCLSEKMTSVDEIQARCNVWAKNRILNEIYREKIKTESLDENPFIDDGTEDDMELMIYVDQVLTPTQKRIFDMLLAGYSQDEIMKKMKIQKAMFYRHLKNIKEKIKNRE